MGMRQWLARSVLRSLGYGESFEQSLLFALGSGTGGPLPTITDKSFKDAFGASAWVFACIASIASAVGSVPFDIFQRLKGKDWAKDEEGKSDLAQLLDYVNADDDICSLHELTTGWLACHGNAYIHKLRPTPEALPVALRVLPSDLVEVVAGQGQRSSRVKGYRILAGDFPILPDVDVVHVKLLSFDPLYGMPPVRPLTQVINTWNAITRYKYNLFRNGGMPSALVKIDKPVVDDEERRKFGAAWDMWRGPDSAGRPLLIGSSMEYQETGLAPDRLAAPLLSQEARETICGVYGVPPTVVGLLNGVNYNTARTQRKTFWTETVIPRYLRRIVTAFNEQLVPEFAEKSKMSLRLAADLTQIAALQEDANEQADTAKKWISAGVKTPNEVREELGLPPSETEGANDLQITKPSAPGTFGAAPVTAPVETESDSEKAVLELLDEILQRVTPKE